MELENTAMTATEYSASTNGNRLENIMWYFESYSNADSDLGKILTKSFLGGGSKGCSFTSI